jgi:hypothetical protein
MTYKYNYLIKINEVLRESVWKVDSEATSWYRHVVTRKDHGQDDKLKLIQVRVKNIPT